MRIDVGGKIPIFPRNAASIETLPHGSTEIVIQHSQMNLSSDFIKLDSLSTEVESFKCELIFYHPPMSVNLLLIYSIHLL